MRHKLMQPAASLLSILLMTFHLSDDIVRGMEPGGTKNILGVLILVVWLYGTLVLADRRSGQVIILLGSLLGAMIPVVHMRASGLVGGDIAGSKRGLLLGMDDHGARRDRHLLPGPLGTWTTFPRSKPGRWVSRRPARAVDRRPTEVPIICA